MNNTEIEKRFSVVNENDLLEKLETLRKKAYENHQIDTYYVPKHRNFLDEKYPFECLRLRTTLSGQGILIIYTLNRRI